MWTKIKVETKLAINIKYYRFICKAFVCLFKPDMSYFRGCVLYTMLNGEAPNETPNAMFQTDFYQNDMASKGMNLYIITNKCYNTITKISV